MNEIYIKNIIQKNFNNAHKTYDIFCHIQNRICDASLKLLKQYKDEFTTIIDLACGTGESTKKIISQIKYKNCYAVDFAEHFISLAKSKLPDNIKIILSDFEKEIFLKNSIDLIFCNMGLQWASNFENAINLFLNYLKTNGILIFSLPINNNFPEIKDAFKFKFLQHDKIINIFTSDCCNIKKYQQINYIEEFINQLQLLQSLKYVGAKFSNIRISKENYGLNKNSLKNFFIQADNKKLTYKIGIYLIEKT